MINEENMKKLYNCLIGKEDITTKELNGCGFHSKDISDLVKNGTLTKVRWGHYILSKVDEKDPEEQAKENEYVQEVLRRVNKLVKCGKIKEASEICEANKEYSDIEKKHIKILRKLAKDEEALEICKKYPDDPTVLSQQAAILYHTANIEEALKVFDLPLVIDNPVMQEQRISYLIEFGRYEEALKIIERPEFKNVTIIQYKRAKIPSYILNDNEVSSETDMSERIASKLADITYAKLVFNRASIIYTKIYNDDITLDEIESSNTPDFERTVLKVMYYEKNKLPGVLDVIKKAKKELELDQKQLDILDKLYARLSNKKEKILDYKLYETYIKCELRNDLVDKHRKTNETDTTLVVKKVTPVTPRRQSTNLRLKPYRRLKALPRIQVGERVFKEKKPKEYDLTKLKIKDIFPQEIYEIKRFIYVEMNQSKSKMFVDIWDRFEVIIEKSLSDKDALDRFIEIAFVVNKLGNYISIDIENMEGKRNRFVKPEDKNSINF